MNKFRRFLINGFLLTAVSLIMRTVSVTFNVYVSNTIGAEGMGLFALISSVYSFALTVATSGINLAATRLVSESLGRDGKDGSDSVLKNKKIQSIMLRCIVYSLLFSVTTALFLFVFSESIGIRLLRDRRTVSSLRILAVSLPPIAVSSALSGYFSAVRRVYKNAIVSVFGQAIKIGVTVSIFGSSFYRDTESACVAMVLGGTVAEILSFLIQFIMYRSEKNQRSDKEYFPQTKGITKNLLGIALPVAFSTYIRSGLITIEHMLIPVGLEKSGASKDASLADYGTVHSMVFPLVLYPSAILSSFAGLLIPEVAQAGAAHNERQIKRITLGVMKLALLFAIGTAGIIGCFSYELGNAIYPDSDAGKYIRMIAPLIPVMYIDTATDAILKGLGQQVYSMWVNIIDASLSVVLVIFLLPKYGIIGYIITVYFTEILNAALSITKLLTITDVKPPVFSFIIKPLICVACAVSVAKLLYEKTSYIFASDTFEIVFFILLSVVLYFIALFISQTIQRDEIKTGWELVKKDS